MSKKKKEIKYLKLFSMIELTDLQKIGLGLVGFGGLFLTFGVFLFLDKVLLALGNILFLAGLCLLIGVGRTMNFFWQPHNPVKMKVMKICTLQNSRLRDHSELELCKNKEYLLTKQLNE